MATVVATQSASAALLVILILVVGISLYFLPSIIASHRKVPDRGAVIVINLLLGWSFIGWVVALAMAFRTPEAAKAQQYAQAFDSGSGGKSAALPNPGWYKDPSGVGTRRYWDGSTWTEAVVDKDNKPLPSSPV